MDSLDLKEKLTKLEKNGLVKSAIENIEKWLNNEEFEEFWPELQAKIDQEKVEELNDAFYKVIPFGTGGRRGKMGLGTNRINSRTIAESAQGFANYLNECVGKEEVKKRGIVITYDIRHNSRKFAEEVAGVLAGNGIMVYFFDGVRSTPQLSFTVRHQNAIGGAMISASHNPPEDNGVKLYWQTGGQIVPPHDANIIEKVSQVQEIFKMDFTEAVKKDLVKFLGKEVDLAYYSAVSRLSLGDYREAKIVFTPLHGCATTSFLPVLKQSGFKNIIEVTEQMTVDPDFSSIKKQIPNPEVPISLELGIEYAKKKQADLVLAADPDADRIGVISRESFTNDNYVFLNGNQIGSLLLSYIVTELKVKDNLPKNGLLIKTLVTTDLLTKIAQKNNIEYITDLPVGFKYIADAIENRLEGRQFLFGAEESHGYLHGDYARDKDGAIGALLICEYASKLKHEGKTLFEQLELIKKEYGYYRELLQSVIYPGMQGMEQMAQIMTVLRDKLPKEVAGLKVFSVLDQLNKKIINPGNNEIIGEYVGFTDNALIFYLNPEKTIRVVARPSGTEPKIKFYAAVGKEVGLEKTDLEYQEIKKECDDLAYKILEYFTNLTEAISPGGNKFEILG